MSEDEKSRRPLQTREEAQARRQAADKRPPRRPMRFIFKLLGLVLVLFAGWLAWYSYRTGKLPDLTDPNQSDRAMKQLASDAEQAKDKSIALSRQAIDWAQASLSDLEKIIKGNPPKTIEESKKLVDETKRDVEKPAPPPPPPAATPKPPDPLADARAEYEAAQKYYVLTDPSLPQKQVQENLHLAEPHFVKCLTLLDAAKGKGASQAEIDRLEQATAIRLYDVHKRITLSR